MRGLLLKDLMLHKKTMLQTALGYLFAGGFAVLVILSMYYGNLKGILEDLDIFNQSGISGAVRFISFCIAFLGGYCATSASGLFSEDQKADFVKVSYSLPVSAGERIRARYAVYGICLALILALSVIIQPALYLVSDVRLDGNALLTVFAGFFPCTALFLAELPLIYWFGIKAQRIMNIVFVLVIGLLLLWCVNYVTGAVIPIQGVLRVITYIRNLCALLFFGVLLIGFPLSGLASARIAGRNMLW